MECPQDRGRTAACCRPHRAFALKHPDRHRALIILSSRKHLTCLGADRGVPIDQPREHAAERLDAERERRHIKQQHVRKAVIGSPFTERRTCRLPCPLVAQGRADALLLAAKILLRDANGPKAGNGANSFKK